MTSLIGPDGSVNGLTAPMPAGLALSPSALCGALRATGVRACCLDNLDAVGGGMIKGGLTGLEALDLLVSSDPRYLWENTTTGLLNVFPRESVLNEQVPRLRVAGSGLWEVLEGELGLSKYGIELFEEFREGSGPALPNNIGPGPLRSVLNDLVAPVANSVWHIAGRPGAYSLTIAAVG